MNELKNNVDDPKYLRGVNTVVHSDITTAQNKWRQLKMKEMGLNPNNSNHVQQFWKTVNLKEVQKFENELELKYGTYFIKTGATKADVTAVKTLTNSQKNLNKFRTSKGSRLAELFPQLATALAIFTVFASRIEMAHAIAFDPDAAGDFEKFMQNYELTLKKVLDGGRVNHDEGINLINLFQNYLESIKADENARSIITNSMRAWCDLNLQ